MAHDDRAPWVEWERSVAIIKTIFAFSVFAATVLAAPLEPVPYTVPAKLPDRAEMLSPAAVHVDGWLGARIDANEKNRLLEVDTEPLLAGYRNRPGTHPWIGEHIGKWLHAATLAWAYTGDPALRAKLDRVVADLIKCQEPDGYLGTYVPGKRLGLYSGAEWDVWSHKYNLIGLLTYYQYTGNEPALAACRKMGDLLAGTFPAKRSILAAALQRAAGGAWETVGELGDYPADGSTLQPGQAFTLRLAAPVKAVAVRVLGVPACGNNPKQAFSSCAELQAFGD